MSEIEKMYENAGIKPYIYCSKPQLDCDARENGNCKQDCEYYSGEKLLTQFTAGKQLKLIKWLIIEGYVEDMLTVQISEENFEVCLADTFNELWQDLTEEEKRQVKGILE